MENYEENIGKKVMKVRSRRGKNKKINKKKFKSGLYTNTVKGVINHPILNIPAYTFEEDDSYADCRGCEVVPFSLVERAREKGIEDNKKKFNTPKKLRSVEMTQDTEPTHEVVDTVDGYKVCFKGDYQACQLWKYNHGFGYQIRPTGECDMCEEVTGYYLGTTCPKCKRSFRNVKIQ